eukprot:36017_1
MSPFRMPYIAGHSLACIILSIIIKLPTCLSKFLVGQNRIPFANSDMAIGYDETNDDILLLGGVESPQHFVVFKNDNFIDHGQGFFNDSFIIKGVGQFYTQLGNILWILTSDEKGFYTFDTTTYQIQLQQCTVRYDRHAISSNTNGSSTP